MDESTTPAAPKGFMRLPDGSYLREIEVVHVADNGDETTSLTTPTGTVYVGGPLQETLDFLDGRPPKEPKPDKPPKEER